MSARILTAATVAAIFAGVLPAKAADSQLLNLVMPDAVVIAGVNVEQAKATPFGQYILSQVPSQDPHMQELIAQTGFDPTRDVHEFLAASNQVGASNKGSGLILARGTFDSARFATAAGQHGGVTESYKSVTIIEDPKQTHGFAFLNTTIAVAGDIASVKGAIDRQSSPAPLPAALLVQINHWSTTQDAWAISNVPLASLANTPPAAKSLPGLNGQGSFQAIQSAAGGVKYGDQIVITAQAQADTADNAKVMADTLKLLASLVQLQASKEPAAAAVLQSLTITAQGSTLNVSLSVPEDLLQKALKPAASLGARKLEPRK